MKWENIEPEPNQFDFGPADEIVAFAESIDARMRGHNFMWFVFNYAELYTRKTEIETYIGATSSRLGSTLV